MYSEGTMGLRSRVFVISISSSSAHFFSALDSSTSFGNLVPISVSFLVCSGGSDPHFNPCLAVTEINWLGSLSECPECVLVFLPAWNSSLSTFSLHSTSSAHQDLFLKLGKGIVFFSVLSERMLELWILFIRLGGWMSAYYLHFLVRQIVMEWIEITLDFPNP